MAQFIEGLDRQQTMLLPEHLDNYVNENSPVRAIDAFTDMLDLTALGFNTRPAARVSSGVDVADLYLRVSQSSAIVATVGA